MKLTGLTQNLGQLSKARIGIFSQPAGSTREFWAGPANFTFALGEGDKGRFPRLISARILVLHMDENGATRNDELPPSSADRSSSAQSRWRGTRTPRSARQAIATGGEVMLMPPIGLFCTDIWTVTNRIYRDAGKRLYRARPATGEPVPRGWHLDEAWAPELFEATPRQTYFQMFAALRDVLPGAG